MGGFMDSDANALTVVPCGRLPSNAVAIDTGVHTDAITARKRGSKPAGAVIGLPDLLRSSVMLTTHAATAADARSRGG
jgi:hypothetical protein